MEDEAELPIDTAFEASYKSGTMVYRRKVFLINDAGDHKASAVLPLDTNGNGLAHSIDFDIDSKVNLFAHMDSMCGKQIKEIIENV